MKKIVIKNSEKTNLFKGEFPKNDKYIRLKFEIYNLIPIYLSQLDIKNNDNKEINIYDKLGNIDENFTVTPKFKLMIEDNQLIELSTGNIPIFYAALYGYDTYIRQEYQNKDVNILNNNKDTPLHYAVKGEHLSTIELLLSLNANKNIKNEEGLIPLDIAEELEFEEAIYLL